MSDNFSDLFENIKKMVNEGNIPSDITNMLNNITNNNPSNSNSPHNKLKEEKLNSDNSSPLNNNSNNSFNIDINTILKMQNIISAMNQKDDPRANLLYSLKPYLRENKKSKLDQYVNLLNMTKIADFMKNTEKKENNDNA